MKKVIFHIDEMRKWKLSINNIKNIISVISKEDRQVKLLVNGEAVKIYKENLEEVRELQAISDKDVEILFCENSINKFKIKVDYIPDYIKLVPTGVLELINRQLEGYAYIKP